MYAIRSYYVIESERLLTARRKNEGKVIANDIYSRYGEEIYNNIYKETQNTETLSSREKLKYLYLEQKQIEKKYHVITSYSIHYTKLYDIIQFKLIRFI